jgi:galactokinase
VRARLPRRIAWAPGRVNLMGDHTDHSGGLVLPAAVALGTTVQGDVGGDAVVLASTAEAMPAVVPLDVADPSTVQPEWARYVAGVVSELRPATGFRGTVSSTLPIGAGLSSSASLEVAVALALGWEGDEVELARLCQRAEQVASGVPCGIMDQLASSAGRSGHALRIDCTTLEVEAVPIPSGIEIIVVHSGEDRVLAGSPYAERAAACRAAESRVGPLRCATLDDVDQIGDEMVRRRARHVVTENARVDAMVDALGQDDHLAIADIMSASHASLRDDFQVSTPILDELVDTLARAPGAIGARLTGAGFGGCVVALVEAGTTLQLSNRKWRVRPSHGAHLVRPVGIGAATR